MQNQGGEEMKKLFLVQKKCKCGKFILVELGNDKDGDLIEHDDCEFNKEIKRD
jgi:hypothetical protein